VAERTRDLRELANHLEAVRESERKRIAHEIHDELEVLEQLKAEFPHLPVLMPSTCPDRQYAVRSLKLGAAGYLNKSAGSEQLTEAVRHVAQGKLFITPAVAEPLASAVGAGGHEDKPLHELLSQREFQVFTLLSCGASVGEIADRLALSSNTVSTFRAHILEKTGVRIDVELALYAMQHAS